MNYVLQVVRGRSATTTLRLADGVTTLGRHDDCLIRIKSSQVSRRHCEILEVEGRLAVRDLGSSNGTFVNGKRVLGQQPLKAGDELTVGGVTLRVVTLGGREAAAPQGDRASKPGDTAVVDAVPIEASDEDEFEIAFDDEAQTNLEVIPLADQESAAPAAKPAVAGAAKASAAEPAPKAAAQSGQEEDAVAEFLLDLNLDEE
jgi:pSer/pThr/pTyr-binding forkhead associated (FHA) protein